MKGLSNSLLVQFLFIIFISIGCSKDDSTTNPEQKTQYRLTVKSSISDVLMEISPNDVNGQGNGLTQLTRLYKSNTIVTLSAPAIYSSYTFKKWLKNGAEYSSNRNIVFSISANDTFTAEYSTTICTLVIESQGILNGVNVDVVPNDINGQGSGVTQLSRFFNYNTSINLVAPETFSNLVFQKWLRNGLDYSTNRSISFSIIQNDTFYAVYHVPQFPGYTSVWNDEFDKVTLDFNKWTYEVNGDGGGNNELQYYTDLPTNSFIQDGKLIIKAIYENYQNRNFTSARIRSANKGDWLYGRIEIKAKLPSGLGTFPEIWMLSTDWEYGGWPESGEIDIMQHVGYDPNVVHGSIHTKAYNHLLGTQKTAAYQVPTATTDFHIYAVEWFEDHIDFYIDKNKYFTVTNENRGWQYWPFDKRFHLILNLAVGGNWGGAQGVDVSDFPAQMEVDYVRVYKKD